MPGTRVNEVGVPISITANGSKQVANNAVLVHFICNTAGNIAVTDSASNTLLAATALTAGQCLPLLFEMVNGGTVTLSGGCVGTLVLA